MIRYAIISDIHGNLEALNAVVADIKKQNIDRVICLGDIISKGSHGHECIEVVKRICDAVVRGNNDVKFAKSLDEIALDGALDYDEFLWMQKQLTREDISYLRSLPMCCEFNLSGRLVRCFHATADDTGKSIFNFDGYGEKLDLFYPTQYTTKNNADVVVYAHSHFAGYEKLFGYTLINAGSVGNVLNVITNAELNNPHISEFTMAEYVILSGEDGLNKTDISIEFRQVEYDKHKELGGFNYPPQKEVYEKEIVHGEYMYPERVNQSLQKNGINIGDIRQN